MVASYDNLNIIYWNNLPNFAESWASGRNLSKDVNGISGYYLGALRQAKIKTY